MRRLEDMKPIIEGRLYEWGSFIQTVPSAPVSTAYEEIRSSTQRTSPQERWILRWQEHAELVERVLGRLSLEQRMLVMMRYRDRLGWAEVAESLHMSARKVFNLRDQVLTIMGYELGLLSGEDDDLAG